MTNKEIAIKTLKEVSNPTEVKQNKKGQLVISTWYDPLDEKGTQKLLKCPAIADVYNRTHNGILKTYITLK